MHSKTNKWQVLCLSVCKCAYCSVCISACLLLVQNAYSARLSVVFGLGTTPNVQVQGSKGSESAKKLGEAENCGC